jgi:hypothetical protein
MLDWIVGYVESRFIITPHLQKDLSQHFQVMRTDNGTEYVNDEFGKKNQKKEYFNNFVL